MIFQNIDSFKGDDIRAGILTAFDRVMTENDPAKLVRQFLNAKRINAKKGRIYVIGFGKAGRKMYDGARAAIGPTIYKSAIIIPKDEIHGSEDPFLPGDHPFPLRNSLRSSKRLLDILKDVSRDDTVIALISGGGSAMFEVLEDNVSLEDYNEKIRCAMSHGADIYQLNALRFLYSKVKGGGLLGYTYPARVIALSISDVPGNDIRVISSGPLSDPPDSSFVKKTMRYFSGKCGLQIEGKKLAGRYNYNAENHIIFSNRNFVEAFAREIGKKYQGLVSMSSEISGSTDEVARVYASILRKLYSLTGRPVFFVSGGETTTMIRGSGKGGRNLELCLKFMLQMRKNEKFVFGSFGTDGIDGNSGAMGAIVNDESLEKLERDYIVECLSKSASLDPLIKSGDALFTGRTGTNVSDIFVGYYAGRK
jgi:glycerate 2-kinase